MKRFKRYFFKNNLQLYEQQQAEYCYNYDAIGPSHPQD